MAMTIDLTGKTALVTGASRGIGRAIAAALAEAGASVIGVGTHLGDATEDFARLGTPAAPARALSCDLGDRAQIAELIARLDGEGTAVDILVNNAGIIRRAPALDHAIEDWDAVRAVNLDAPFLLAQGFGRKMAERGGGKIVNLASVLSVQGGKLVPGYAASKAAIANLTRALANEWASLGINVNAVAPGYVATDNTAALQADPERERELMARIPVGRWLTAEEIARPVVFLASDWASAMHGTTVAVDGGWLAR
jgi:2-deoxy-D-gluconate 3-dehydrogenase